MSATRKKRPGAGSSSSQEPSQNSFVPARTGREHWTHPPPEVNKTPQLCTPHLGCPVATLSVPDTNFVNAAPIIVF